VEKHDFLDLLERLMDCVIRLNAPKSGADLTTVAVLTKLEIALGHLFDGSKKFASYIDETFERYVNSVVSNPLTVCSFSCCY